MKRAISLFLSLVLVLSLFPFGILSVSADYNTCGENITWVLEDGTLTLSGYGEMYHYEFYGNISPWAGDEHLIKKLVVSEGITSIGNTAFCDFVCLTDVSLPSTIKSIGVNAFSGCSKLEEFTIPAALEILDGFCFTNCYSLVEFKVAEGNANFCAEDGVLYSADKTVLWNYPIGSSEIVFEMPNTVEHVAAYAFSEAANLRHIEFGNQLKSVGDEAFHNCIGLTSITLKDGFQRFGGGAFQGCENLSVINLPDSVHRVGPLAFDQTAYYNNLDNWESDVVLYLDNIVLAGRESWDSVGDSSDLELTGDYTIKEGTTIIADEAFDFLSDLTSITFPSTLKVIGEGAFYGCDSLTEVTVPVGVTHIYEIAFTSCDALSKIILPSTLQHIGYTAFEKTLYINGLVDGITTIGYDGEYVIIAENATADANVREGTILIAEQAFEPCGSNLKSVSLPEGLLYIGAEAFLNNYSLKTVSVPKSVTSIGDYAFGFSKQYDYVKEEYVYEKVYGFVLNVYTGSVAEAYAKKFGIQYKLIDGCDHSYRSETKEATCTTNGVITYTCTQCGDTYVETIPAAHTNIVYDPAVKENCAFDGLTAGSHCEACGTVLVAQTVIPSKGHNVTIEPGQEPTCGKDGWIGRIWCEDCQRYITDRQAIPATGDHKNIIEEPGIDATCYSEGWTSLIYCADCDLTISHSTVIPPLEHTHIVYPQIDPTCGKDGRTEYVWCEDCQRVIEDYQTIPATNLHRTIVYDPYEPPTCSEYGKTQGSHCVDCGKVIEAQEMIPKLTHEYDDIYYFVCSTITERGYKYRMCRHCYQQVDQLPIPYAPIVNFETTNEGLKLSWNPYPYATAYRIYRYDINASAGGGEALLDTTTKTTFVDKTVQVGDMYIYLVQGINEREHTVSRSNSEPITYTGVTECDHIFDNACDTNCNTCGEAREVSHAYKAATCTTPKTCKVCGIISGKALGHKSDKGSITKKATCTSTGTRTYTCTVCDKKLKTEVIAKIGHSYSSATCTKAKTCKVCKATTGSKLGHKYTNNCDVTCNTCGYKRTITHAYKTVTKAATTAANGYTVKRCSVCKKETAKNTIYKVATIKLSKTAYTYNGKTQKPSVIIKDSKGKTVTSANYTVTYASDRKNVGTYKVTVKFKGKYSGSKTLSFKITPAGTTVKSLTAGKKALKVTITKKTAQVSGYEIQYATNSSFKSYKAKTLTGYKKTTLTLSNLKAKTTYYVRVRTYKVVNGKKIYSTWSSVKKMKTK